MLRIRRVRARGEFRFEVPRFMPWVYAFMRLASPVYDRWVEGIGGFQPRGVERLIMDLLRRPRRAVWVPGALSILPWVEAAF
ncbi:MAG: hypothetical protein A2064_05925 [Spirochaetes bacterium GWB1_66_5]|nr:MAG: hypothetical protein A2064_05925 [Spirochaetes bacterium GWB1_66_5]